MSYAHPSAAEFKARFVAFGAVADATVSDALEEARGAVGSHWTDDRAYRSGAMLFAAHTLALWGHGTGAEAEMARAGTLGFTSVSDGAMSVSRASTGDGTDTLDATMWGREYRNLRARSVPLFGLTRSIADADDHFDRRPSEWDW